MARRRLDDLDEDEMIALLEAADNGSDALRRKFLKAMRETDWGDYREFRFRLAGVMLRLADEAKKRRAH